MSNLDLLLSSVFSPQFLYKPGQVIQLEQGRYPLFYAQQLQQQRPCNHPCPTCAENTRLAMETMEKKHNDYKNRCKVYMEKWRNARLNP